MKFLHVEKFGEFGYVTRKEKLLDSWKRFFPSQRTRFISEECGLRTISCAACGNPLRPTLGVWISRPSVSVTSPIAQDEFGYDHLSRTHPLVIPLDLAVALQKKLGRYKFQLLPIWSHESETVALIRRCVKKLEELVAPSADEN